MIIQATPYGTKKEEPFAFTYSGDFTDERVDGTGDVTLNTSGVFEVLSGKATVSVYILGGGGGGAGTADSYGDSYYAGGGGGGNQTVWVELAPGTYEIVVGLGGTGVYKSKGEAIGTAGGDTTAFGYTSTGGGGGGASSSPQGGTGGKPNGRNGKKGREYVNGGSPNGGQGRAPASANAGGNGLVRITFS